MSNPVATGKKAKRGPELVQRIRAAILNTFDAVEEDGKLISEILAVEFKENPLKFMDMASKYCPKEVAMEVESNITHHVTEMTEDELIDDIRAARAALRKPVRGTSKAKAKPNKSTSVH